jgi:hypothetical protein
MWSAGPGTPNHYQPLDALGLLLYIQQVLGARYAWDKNIQHTHTHTHIVLKRGTKELRVYVALSGIMGEETKRSKRQWRE